MIMMFMQIHSLILATNSILIEKGLIEKDVLEKKSVVIFSLMREYASIMASEKEEDKEKEKLERLLEIAKKLVNECKFEINQLEDDFIKKQFESRAIVTSNHD